MRTLIKNGMIIDPSNNFEGVADILIEDGKIKDLGKELNSEDVDVVDCKGSYIVPGLIDMHCHLREPGFEYKETIETGIMSAAVGGFTSIACMPNTKPVVDNSAVLKYIKEKADAIGMINLFPIACITKRQEGHELAEIGELKLAGAVAVSDDGKPVSNPLIMRRALQYSKMFDILVISHCEELELVDEGVMNEGYVSTILGLKGIPREAEEVMVARDILLAEHNDCPIHIAHVSTRGSVELIRNAKRRKVKVTAETCPHYFSITDQAVLGFNTNAKVNPPLRTEDDVKAIIEGLMDDTIDVIATDHAPHHVDEKNVEFNLAAFGMVGFETALPLAVTNLVKTGHLTYKKLIEKMSYNPARILGINKGTLSVGSDADITIFDPNEEVVIDINKFKSKGRNSPFDGYKLNGRVSYTIVGGKII